MGISPAALPLAALWLTIIGTGCAAVPEPPPGICRPLPAAYLGEVPKPVPPDEARPAVDLLAADPAGRAFLVYVQRLSSSWDLIYGDRLRLGRLADE
jgi:hypothetical protein